MKILILNGPNINLLGVREPEIYGKTSYKEMIGKISEYCNNKNIETEFYQSNHEGKLVDKLQEAYFSQFDGIILNAAAYTHTSIAILDALKAINIPTVEVHLTDIDSRESFRKTSVIRDACIKTICEKGINGYLEACDFLEKYILKK